RRLRSLLNAKGARMRHRFKQGAKFLLGAVLVAAIVQLLRPADTPKNPENTSELPAQINLVLEDAAMGPPGGRVLQYSEEQLNAYIANRLKSKRKALSSYLQFEGATVALEEGFARGTVERSLLGFSVYTTAIFAPRVEGGTVSPHVVGGKIGHMPIHPALMKYSDVFFTDAVAVFDREIKSIARLGGIELHPKLLIINPKPGAVTAPAPSAQALAPAAVPAMSPGTQP
ncbi:MAG: hypothetical protein ABI946_06205, partial [Chthoniobacterales bacterium]